jgi:hypothetical protein
VLGSSWRTYVRWSACLGAIVIASCLLPAVAGAVLPDGRGYELVSPPQKLGVDIIAESSRTHAAAVESPGLPAAVAFMALGGFGDVRGVGLASEYLAQRTGTPGTNGWSTHAITPRQDPLTFIADAKVGEFGYDAEMANDLTKGAFRAWSPLTNAPNTQHVENVYVREDLRTAGAGLYRLCTDAPFPIPARDPTDPFLWAQKPWVAGATQDFQHVLIESNLDLTSDATGNYIKLYKNDGTVTRLVAAGTGCPGGRAQASVLRRFHPGQCSIAGIGANGPFYTPRVLSTDGSRTEFTSPVDAGSGKIGEAAGAVGKVFQLDDRGTATTADDAVVQLNSSEKTSPDTTGQARYQTASTDGSRVFFTSSEQLTDTPGGGLYMWERQPTNETQSITVDATGGSFQLTFHSQPSTGTGTLTNGSNTITSLDGSFAAGQTISGTGIPAGTTITAVRSNGTMTLSQAATADGPQTLSASLDGTTTPLAFDATPAQVQSALEALPDCGSGNATVTGGPGNPGGSSPYLVTFTGALAGVNVAQLTTDGSTLTGAASTATVTTTTPIHNLTLLAPIGVSDATGVLGASEDGHRVYFTGGFGQLVPGGPPVISGLYLWQDADGTPGGSLSFVGDLNGDRFTNLNASRIGIPRTARVSPDGRFLLFQDSIGDGLRPRYDQSACTGGIGSATNNSAGGCSEVYLYKADSSTPTDPDVVCASCIPSGAPATTNAYINARAGASAAAVTQHLSHALSDDGRHVFFWTAEPLVPEDTNNKADVYEYDVPTGTVHLITSGKDTADSYFLDASATGHDIYFLTRQRLVGWDTDTNYDLYDARIGGGFPEPPPATHECIGDSCQGQPSAPPQAPSLGSAFFHGLGNATPPTAHTPRRTTGLKCKRGHIKRRVHGKVRCVRKHHTRHRPRA